MSNEAKLRDYLKRATSDLDRAQRRIGELEANKSEPIAIVGMSCRYPGGVDSPEGLWRLLATGRDGIDSFPDDRGWDLERLYDPDPDSPGTSYVREGGFLADAAEFDAEFFGIAPREALAMDPQQRLLLEASWQALEDAGIDPAGLGGVEAGVFAGVMGQAYSVQAGSPPADLEGYIATGSATSVVAGRVAYALGIEGPAISVDTACSSSLVALHLAAGALRGGECSLALAGGATVLSSPVPLVEFSRQRVLSPDGRCKSFSESADGVGWSEGVGVLVLERLSDAEREGHPILATIRGSAVNQDGASNGLTAPNGPSQERVIRQALANAGLEPKDVDAVEAHGTGTTLGDPIEAGALLATYGQEREEPLRLGSIKSNIGHAQAAAGVAGVIKAVMAMRAGVLPKTLHVDQPSSKVDWSAGKVELLTEEVPWEPNGRPRRAGVSSFGISGTNAHVILEEAPEPVSAEHGGAGAPEAPGASSKSALEGPIPLVLSAKSEPALKEAASRLASHVKENPELEPTDLAYSLATTRSSFEHRAVALGEDRDELLSALSAIAEGTEHPGIARGRAPTERPPVFLFPGQGSQWLGMGAQLIAGSPAFDRCLGECEEALAPHLDWSVRDVLLGADGAPSIERIEVVQPVLFAIAVALAELWRACGVRPAAVAGHSQGEIAAVHVAGGLSLDDAARLAAVRSRIISRLAGQGAMVSVILPPEQLRSRLARWDGRIELAAQNGPSATILSADREALEGFLEQCEEEGVRAREVPATIPSHSAHVEPLRDELLEALAPISPRSGEIPFHSTVTGERLDTGEMGPEYWYRNLRERVRFEQVTRGFLEQGHRVFVEVSPHPVFALAVGETIEETLADPGEASVLATLRRGEGGPERFALSLAQAHASGAKLDREALFGGTGAKRVPLPTYPFQRKRYWLSSSSEGDVSSAGLTSAEHPLLGASISLPGDDGLLLTGRLSLSTHPWLADHAVAGTVLLPGTAFLELALKAGEEAGAGTVEEMTLQSPLVLPEQGARAIQVSVSGADEQGRREFQVHSRPEGEEEEWTCNAQGVLASEEPVAPEPLGAWPPEGAEAIEVADLYERLADAGFDYGPAFQGVTAAWKDGEEIYAEVSLAEEQATEAGRFAIHPALLDSALHALVLATEEAPEPQLPFVWSGVSPMAQGADRLLVKLLPAPEERTSVALFDHEGAPVAQGSLALRALDPAQLQGAGQGREGLLGIEWQEAPLGDPAGIVEVGDLAQLSDDADPLDVVVVRLQPAGGGGARAARETAGGALELVQRWLSEERLTGSRLAILTKGAIAAKEDESPDPALASAWGLLRSAASEHPGRFVLIDTDGTGASREALPAALGIEDEPQLALRAGTALVARATRIQVAGLEEGRGPVFDPDKTVLITGGTGTLGSLLACHLAEEHGARHLLLASRSGPEAQGAKELQAELEGLGAEVTIAACDASDRPALGDLLTSIPQEHPLGAVIHTAGAIDDGLIEAMSPERLQRTFAPKADAAWALHELTRGSDLSAFVLFSSAAGALGGAGQANYAAANAFLDALAAQRHSRGLPATSIAWGLWEGESEMTSHLGDADLARMRRSGIAPLPEHQGLALFEQALRAEGPAPLAIGLDRSALRSQASAGTLPALLRGLVPAAARSRSAASGSSFATKLASLQAAEREPFARELVRKEVAGVLGHGSPEAIDPAKAFKDLGFDSLAAVELRNRLSAVTGMRLAATTVFDYPTTSALAAHLLAETGAAGSQKEVVIRARSSEEAIAIVGMSCRYPGGADSPERLWQLVATGADGIDSFPDDRGWDLGNLYDPDPDVLGASYARHGGFLADAAEFDAEFFGIAPREALAMDPQQRLLLEASWRALEDAGIDPALLHGSQAGVFTGVMYQDYGMHSSSARGELEGYVGTGATTSVASGRVAYALGLQGPAMSVDTACSSSLVALHLAAKALRGGECDLALAGGVTVLASPGLFIEFSRQRGLSPDGRCRAFAEAADGTGFSEGVGILVLQRLSDAQREGHPILATIKGSAVNQDGASNGLTAPNGPSQERVIRQALANAGLEPKDVDAVEAHGTGTTLGDPIEAGALLATYGQDRETPLRLGSIKSNIGHAQAAAGVAGVIKAVMAMRAGVLPRTLHAEEPSSKVDWSAGKVELLTEEVPWEPNGRPRRAGVSSFGASGTNAHLILEEAPVRAAAEDEAGGGERAPLSVPIPLVLSAKTEPALREAASRLATHVKDNPELSPTDLAYSLTTTRSSFEHRAVALGEDREQLLQALSAISDGTSSPNALNAKAREGKLAYLLTGQGSQRLSMGSELYQTDPAFKEAFEGVCEALEPHLQIPLPEILFAKGRKAEESLTDTTYAQPALFALQVALYRSLSARGMTPQLLAGHSVGEISAAHIAGVLDLPDAAKLIAARGRLMGELPKGGAMLATEATEEEARKYLQGKEAELSLAAINGPSSTVLSGTEEAIEAAHAHFKEEGRKAKRLTVSHAFHSPLIEPMLDQLTQLARELDFQEPEIPIVSNLSGELLTPSQATDPSYWAKHARSPVRFADSVRTLAGQGAIAFLELGPDPVLIAMAQECLEGDDSPPALIPSLREGRPEALSIATAIAGAHAAGAALDWPAYFSATGARRVPLPTYPFQRKRYWLSSSSVGDVGSAGLTSAEHPLLAAKIEDPTSDGITLTGRLSLSTHPWLADHAVAGTVLLPGTAFLELALKAGEEVDAGTVDELTLQSPLVLPESGAVAIQVSVSGPDEQGRRELRVHSRPEGEEEEWTCNAQGALTSEEPRAPEPLASWPPEGAEPLEVTDLYERLADAGFDYGPAFQGVTAAWRRGEEIYAEVSLAEEQATEAGRFAIHPALLDSALHAIGLATEEAPEPQLPFAWSGVSLAAQGAGELRARFTSDGEGSTAIRLYDMTNAPLAQGSLALRALDPSQLQNPSRDSEDLLGIEWQQATLGDPVTFTEVEDLTELGEGIDLPEVVGVCLAPAEGTGARAARDTAEAALALAQQWLEDDRFAGSRLAILTEGAIAAKEDESPDPALASAWGLLRSAASEHPGRFVLIDTDGTGASREALPAAFGIEEEPQLALREGTALVARAGRLQAAESEEGRGPVFDPDKTVLITGGTGTLGSLLACHLAEEHGARHLLLASRSGPEAQGAKELQAELEGLGAEVTIAACDVSDRPALGDLLTSIPQEHPLGAVIHTAGAIDDGLIEAMSPERLRRTFAPKADAAWHLHELTEDADLSAFVLFSSAAGALGGAGQANYAAANAFLDALAEKRASEGLPATSIAWGLWEGESEMTSRLGDADLARMQRGGIVALSGERGLALFEQALQAERPAPLAVGLDRSALRSQVSAGTAPALLRGLVRVSRQRPAAKGSLATKLASLQAAEREPFARELVRKEVAGVLGHGSPEAIDPAKAFKDLGFDSLAAVELRNRLSAVTGMRLAATTVFDYPTTSALAAHLLAETGAAGSQKEVVIRARSSEEAIAIVGMSCRYPGGADSPERLWQLVATGADGIDSFPDDRGWDLERLYDPDPDAPGTSYVKEGGFLADAAEFDAEFFGIAPREALAMDPQQRLLLEASWRALEEAGVDPDSLGGDPVGVFAGVMGQDYFQPSGPTRADLEGYVGTGATTSVASGRVAYALGLQGPAMSIDTACSSSLVAMHLASQALRSGECSLALAGGVTVLATPNVFTEFSRQRGLSPDGRCRSFSESADGVGWSEGVGVLVLERLADAEREGHPILATIKGSAVNQDGASNGLTAPNGPSQERVIRQALANAGLEPRDVDAVEAHGTGTTLGDPIEAGALLATYGQDRETPLRLGSIKSNIGHAQAAAGVAGVIKAVMAMRAGVLPRTLHVDAPSSKVDWESGKVELLTEEVPWEPNGKPRRAGVSSFGISGTNAHVILEEAPEPTPAGEGHGEAGEPGASSKDALEGPIPLVLSAKTEPALCEAASRLATHVKENPELEPTDLAYSLATTRSSFEHRAVALGEDREQLLQALSAISDGTSSPNALSARAKEGKLAYLLTGQGSQRLGMGRELYEQDNAFKEAFDQVCEALEPHLQTPLPDVLFAKGKKAEEKLTDTTYAQPALFAIQVALYRSLSARGLTPQLLVGHSVGEISAAHIAGVLDLPDAAKLIAARGRLMGELPKGGAMLATEATEEEARKYLQGKEAELSLAAINGPSSTVLSGTEEAIEAAHAHFKEEGRKAKRLTVSHAFHSPLIEPMLEELTKLAGELDLQEPEIPIVSNLTGGLLTPSQATDHSYWAAHARQPVRFADSVRTLAGQGAIAFLELGPDPVLIAMAQECLEGDDSPPALIPSLREGRPEALSIATAIAGAHAAGAALDWPAYFSTTGAKRVPLPTYPFQRKRYWLSASSNGGDPSAIGQSDAEHPLLGASISLPGDDGLLLTGRLSLSTHPWLADHAVAGTVLLPGTAFLELALKAGEEAGAQTVEELTLQSPLVLPESGAVAIQVSVSGPDEQGRRELRVHSRPEGEEEEWTCNAQGVLTDEEPGAPEPLTSWPPEGAEQLEVTDLYERLADAGFDYGPAFQGVTAAWRRGEEIYAEVSLAEEQATEAGRFAIHPALLDASGHAGIDLMLSDAARSGEPLRPSLPFAWSNVSVIGRGASSLRVRLAKEGGGVAAFDQDGSPLMSAGSIVLRALEPGALGTAAGRLPLHNLDWVPLDLPPGAEPRLAILGEGIEGIDSERYPDLEALAEAIEAGAAVPEALIVGPAKQEGEAPTAAHAAAEGALALAQAWIAEERVGDARLCFLTEGAVAAGAEESPDLATAPLWGLLRSAHSEHPGRFALIDGDGSEASLEALPAALGVEDEPQIALREGVALVPRLTRAEATEQGPEPLDPEKTILITGATGGLGALLARHLAENHGARHLLLISRSGQEAEGAGELQAGLRELGAEATIAACDASDRDQLESLLDAIPEESPLGAVFHCAAVLDDGLLGSLDPERLRHVMAPKADAAWHLHELTEGTPLSHFVLFSSVVGLLGGAGQANYAAANAFLDALAARRLAGGLAGVSLAWGLWRERSGAMADRLEGESDRIDQQIRARLGLSPMPSEQGLALLDAALARPESLLAPAAFDRAVLRSQASAGSLPPVLRGLVRTASGPRPTAGSLAEQLASVPEGERAAAALELVRSHVAAVLGHASGAEVEPERAFRDLGLDSLAAVELRNRLVAATGLRLPPTIVFDHPSAAAVGEHLLGEVYPGQVEGRSEGAELKQAFDQIDSMDLDDLVRRSLEAQAEESEIGAEG